MCGIFGISSRAPDSNLARYAAQALLRLEKRGPDDEGAVLFDKARAMVRVLGGPATPKDAYASEFPYAPRGELDPAAGVAFDLVLAHRRLAILDLSPAGHQPMCDPRSDLWVVHNGEIYNYLEIRAELVRAGHEFSTETDTEVVLAAYREWGLGMLSRFVGMFAFALYDAAANRLLLARDPFGIKPLYYARYSGGVAFSSTIAPLLDLPGVPRDADPQAVHDFLRWGLTDAGEGTMFAAIRQVPPGHYVVVDPTKAEPGPATPYWEPVVDKAAQRLDFDLAAQLTRGAFIDSVRLHLRSDVAVGCALSGGIDSTSIAAAMRHVEPALRIQAFAFVPEDPRLSEEPWIDHATENLSLDTVKVNIRPDDLRRDLRALVREQEMPFGSTSIYAQRRVFEAARRAGVTVMLDGQGADELLAGYGGFLSVRIAELVRGGHLSDAWRLYRGAVALPHVSPRRLALGAAEGLLPPPMHSLAKWAARAGMTPGWLRAEWFRAAKVDTTPRHRLDGSDGLRGALLEALQRSGLPALLRYEDRNSMAFSVESRVPFLTPRLAAFLLSLPPSFLVAPDATTKAVFRAAMKGVAPENVLSRRDKIGFQTPEGAWLLENHDLVKACLASETARRVPCLDVDAALALWDDIHHARRAYDGAIWRMMSLVLWADEFGVKFEPVDHAESARPVFVAPPPRGSGHA